MDHKSEFGFDFLLCNTNKFLLSLETHTDNEDLLALLAAAAGLENFMMFKSSADGIRKFFEFFALKNLA